MSNEDYMLDEDFEVESAREFMDDMTPDEMDFLIHHSNLRSCRSCGEWVSEKYLIHGRCTLCNKSKTHADRRAQTLTAIDNWAVADRIVNQLEEIRR